ncbi:MAG: alpha/beta fold hydrolase [Candidatus Heimdallarchaeaceae archaeon]
MFYDINGIKLNTVSFGSGEETFLGISGFVADWHVWMNVFELLSTKMRCVGYDHRGSGESVALPETITKQAYVDDLISVMDKLGVEQCILGGESFGGTVAILAALQHPERFKGLVIVDTSNSSATPLNEGEKQFINLIKSNHLLAIQEFINSVFPEPDIEHLKRWGVRICMKPKPEVAVRCVELGAEGETNVQVQDIKIPTLVVYGNKDSEAAIEHCTYLAKNIPNATLKVVEGAGHVPILTRPYEVVEEIERRFSI